MLWASLVDDPASHPESFPDEPAQRAERERLQGILRELVQWENSSEHSLWDKARAEIRRSLGDSLPEFLDPFAGGGSTPLEALRLGLKAHASDVNPIPVLINKAQIDYPQRFAGRAPVNPRDRGALQSQGLQGLALDLDYYGRRIHQEAVRRLGHHYPKVRLADGSEAEVSAWLWTRTVRCPNPRCGCQMPLMATLTLSKKKNAEAWVEPLFDAGRGEFAYAVHDGLPPAAPKTPRGAFCCRACLHPLKADYIKEEGCGGRLGSRLMALVVRSPEGRRYLAPTPEQEQAAAVERPEDCPDAQIADNMAAGFRVQRYGLDHFADLFTPRQLTALCTFSDLIAEVSQHIQAAALQAGMADDQVSLEEGGRGARAYAEALAVYLALAVDKLADYNSALCTWHTGRDGIGHTFVMQALPMKWDYAEANPLGSGSGSWLSALQGVCGAVAALPVGIPGEVQAQPAQQGSGLTGLLISTDPPYYDNIAYADISDFFYIWLRRSLQGILPQLFATLATPKREELVASVHRHQERAREFFEEGMRTALAQLRRSMRPDLPLSIYYAYKQQDSGGGSTGWESMLTAVIEAGLTITATWPLRTEAGSRTRALASNALASSVVLVCRPRDPDAPRASYRQFRDELDCSLGGRLQLLQEGGIAPVDLAQAAIGPGMEVYSRYSRIVRAGGGELSVAEALTEINAALDRLLAHGDLRLDTTSLVCLAMYEQYGFEPLPFGEFETLVRARNLTPAALEAVVATRGGQAWLRRRAELAGRLEAEPERRRGALRYCRVAWQALQVLLEVLAGQGVAGCAQLMAGMESELRGQVRSLGWRVHALDTRLGRGEETRACNALLDMWGRIEQEAAAQAPQLPGQGGPVQAALRGLEDGGAPGGPQRDGGHHGRE